MLPGIYLGLNIPVTNGEKNYARPSTKYLVRGRGGRNERRKQNWKHAALLGNNITVSFVGVNYVLCDSTVSNRNMSGTNVRETTCEGVD